MKEKILEIKRRAEKQMSEWNFPNEHYIEAQGALMVCDELLADEPAGQVGEGCDVFLIHREENTTRLYKNGVKVSPKEFTQFYGCKMTDEQKKILKIIQDEYLNAISPSESKQVKLSDLAESDGGQWFKEATQRLIKKDKEHSEKTTIPCDLSWTPKSEQQPDRGAEEIAKIVWEKNGLYSYTYMQAAIDVAEQYHKSRINKELFNFFIWFRKNGEKYVEMSIEKMIEKYLKHK